VRKNRPNLCYRNLVQTPHKLLRFMTTDEYGLSGPSAVSYILDNNRDIVLTADEVQFNKGLQCSQGRPPPAVTVMPAA
jgi:hypothetical protein